MTFSPAQAGVYENREAPKQPDTMVAIASDPKPGQKLSFEISGEGSMPGQDQDASSGGASAPTGETRPGGGLGVPNDSPDPLDKYRWYILGGFGIALAAGAAYIVMRGRSIRVTGSNDPAPVRSGAKLAATAAAAPSGPGHAGSFLQGLKEEIFQLELDHKQGKVSDDEYAKTKAALDQTLVRALKRAQ